MKFEVQDINNAFGVKYWGGVLIKEEQKIYLAVKLSDMKELGVAKTMNSTNKVETWLNTPEGINWIERKLPTVTHTSFGSFL